MDIQQLQHRALSDAWGGRNTRCAAPSILSVRLPCGRTIDLVWRPLAVHRPAEHLALERARCIAAGCSFCGHWAASAASDCWPARAANLQATTTARAVVKRAPAVIKRAPAVVKRAPAVPV